MDDDPLRGCVVRSGGGAPRVSSLGATAVSPCWRRSALSGGAGPLFWNAILHRVGASEFFVDAPIAVMPASWQDTGSGVFTVAVAALVLGFGPGGNDAGRRVAWLALLCGLAAFLVDVYLY